MSAPPHSESSTAASQAAAVDAPGPGPELAPLDLVPEYRGIVGTLVTILAVVVPATVLATLFGPHGNNESVVYACFDVTVAAMYWLFRTNRHRQAVTVFVWAMLAVTSFDVIAYGSIRTVGSLGYLVCVVVAATFLTRRMTVAIVVASCVAVTALCFAEYRGYIMRSDFSMNATAWLSHLIAIIAMGVAIYQSRRVLLESHFAQREELERRQTAERDLKLSEERFSKAFNFSPVAMTISRLSDGVFLEANAADERILGMHRSELIGRSALNTGSWTSPQKRAEFIALLRANGRVLGYPSRMKNKQGETVDTRIWAEIIEINGVECVLGSTLNVTEKQRRESLLLEVARGVSGQTGEAFFEPMVDHLARALAADVAVVGEIELGAMGKQEIRTLAMMYDGALADSANYPCDGTPCGHVLSLPHPWLYSGDLAERFPADARLASGEFKAYGGVALRDADGTQIGVLSVLWRSPQDASPDMMSLLTIFASRSSAELIRLRRDREIRKLSETLEQRVKERTAELEAVNQELDSFAHSVAHDLKSPLRAIDGYTQILTHQLGDRLTPDDHVIFNRVLGSAARMNELIADLLALARVSQGPLQPERVDLSDMAREVVASLRQSEPAREVQIDVQPGVVARCDGKLARIVLENLLSNAWKYSRPAAAAHITFGAAPSGSRGAVEMFVRDNGVGFDMNHAGDLFKPFSRLHQDSQFEGTGIGLATVHRIVERHGGDIRFDASPGNGASFHFSFESLD
jgi:PAS domain S-box-containing protein